MPKKTLTDRTLKALKPAPAGRRYELLDTLVPGLGIRVTDKGHKTFFLQARYPGARENGEDGKPKPGRRPPTRRALGEYGAISLEQARGKARAWIELLRKGIDPGHAEREARRQAQRDSENTFEAVAEAFISHIEREGQRKARAVARELRKEFVAPWRGRPITSITVDDVTEIIEGAIDRGARYQAHNLLGHIRRLFNWAIARRKYGLDRSPCDRMRPKDLIGDRALRTRILTDDELRAFWRATGGMEYPWGPLFRLLLVTIQRKSEVAEAVRPEFGHSYTDDNGVTHTDLWVIPETRMKMGRKRGTHVVPLSPMGKEILASLPTFARGDYLFSTTFGKKPVAGFSKAKARLDRLMLEELRKIAAAKGADRRKTRLGPWVLHDLRRTGRTRLSSLPVSELVRELVIAHAKPGLHKVYDQYLYIAEKQRALDLWAARLRDIVVPPPDNLRALPAAVGA